MTETLRDLVARRVAARLQSEDMPLCSLGSRVIDTPSPPPRSMQNTKGGLNGALKKVRFCVYAGRGREVGSGEHGVETGGDGGRESWDGAYQGGRSGLRTTYDAHAARARGEFGFGFGRFGSIRFVLANAHPGNQQPRHFGGDAREQGSGDGGSFVSTFLQGKLGAHWQAQVEGVEGTWRELYDGRGKYVGGESDYAGLSCEAIFWSPVLVKGVCLVELLPDLRPRINAAHSEPGSLTAVQPSMLSKVLKKQMILRVAQDARFSRWSCFVILQVVVFKYPIIGEICFGAEVEEKKNYIDSEQLGRKGHKERGEGLDNGDPT
ncbi:hypothetical protein B0H16DRAFT_1465050 [Mycena metata]|uniref:Uncharacterized protein n=1 Tax=Mycena metata TaxID=1033252 RepID=A0AAD7MZY0_9AGAR|nr:hypothetical protein B0H16DRAFT_1465050 [Mycena metata]